MLGSYFREIEAAGFTVDAAALSLRPCRAVPIEQRRGLMRLLDQLEPDDVLIVTKLDRLGRNAIDMATAVDRLRRCSCRLGKICPHLIDATDLSHRTVVAQPAIMRIAWREPRKVDAVLDSARECWIGMAIEVEQSHRGVVAHRRQPRGRPRQHRGDLLQGTGSIDLLQGDVVLPGKVRDVRRPTNELPRSGQTSGSFTHQSAI